MTTAFLDFFDSELDDTDLSCTVFIEAIFSSVALLFFLFFDLARDFLPAFDFLFRFFFKNEIVLFIGADFLVPLDFLDLGVGAKMVVTFFSRVDEVLDDVALRFLEMDG